MIKLLPIVFLNKTNLKMLKRHQNKILIQKHCQKSHLQIQHQ